MAKGTISSQEWLLANPVHNRAELMYMQLPNGDVLTACWGGAQNITWNGIFFPTASNGSWTRSGLSNSADFHVDASPLTLTVNANSVGPEGIPVYDYTLTPSDQVEVFDQAGNPTHALDLVIDSGPTRQYDWLLSATSLTFGGTGLTGVDGNTFSVVTSNIALISGNFYYQLQFAAGSAPDGGPSHTGSISATVPPPNVVYYPGTTTLLTQCIAVGLFNAAQVTIVTIMWAPGDLTVSPVPTGPSDTPAYFTLFTGQIGSTSKTGRSTQSFKVFPNLYILDRQFPPFQLATSCRHNLFDAGCTLLQANFQSTDQTLDTSSTTLWLNLAVAAHQTSHGYLFGNLVLISNVLYMCTVAGTSAGSAPSFNTARAAVTSDGATLKWTSMGSCAPGTANVNQSYPLGFIIYTGGQNSGLKKMIKAQTLVTVGLNTFVQLQLSGPMPLAVAGGDTVQLVPGCDRSLATCTNIYNNRINHGAQEFVPNPEAAYLG